ncbi:MAG: RdgB/HAM1 family non-canonical purine NTP pyrophosphatase [Actinobacteria bacterium]|nr:RdgB/HAM1 family non-canonical purine NTP pyrophosphatase [Actinomycetota bacterium]MCG2808195.1 RdgB/HAM1 family non-canonical purine NTP pyrophosphatase [Coriobacteriia bacterium]
MSLSSDAPTRVVVATGNAHKVEEIAEALAPFGWEFVSVAELGGWESPAETGTTFEDNARIKALAAHERFGIAALADDSGLEVDALDGAPGVYSARYAGECATDELNNERLLLALQSVAPAKRTARFRSVIVLIDADGVETVVSGTCEGRIGTVARGEQGFGYDPLFLPDATPGLSMAELPMARKNEISHRGAALEALRTKLAR